MNWQLFIAGLIVAGATGYLARQTWRSWSGRKKAGCGGGCCGSQQSSATTDGQANLIPAEQISVRRRSSDPS